MPQNATPQLNPKQTKFVAALLSHATLEAACKELGISHETGRRYLKTPAVKACYDEACRSVFEQALTRLMRLAELAIAVLAKALVEVDPNPARIRAASILLEKAMTLYSARALEQQIAAGEVAIVLPQKRTVEELETLYSGNGHIHT